MKATTLFCSAIAALGLTVANAESTAPVGYETITIEKSAFNYIGIRLHNTILVSGTGMTAADATTLSDSGADFSALSDPSSFYILEVTDGSGDGTIVEFTGIDVDDTNDLITIPDDLTGIDQPFNYNIRPASTLASIFGASNSAGLKAGFFGPGGADIVYVPNGAGGFDRYYYDDSRPEDFSAGWADASDSSNVNAADVPLVYADGVIISATGEAPDTITITGEVKTGATVATLLPGFNYITTVAPAGSTLANLLTPAELEQGFFGPGGADIVYVPNGSGGFDRYYYDESSPDNFAAEWVNFDTQESLVPGDGSGVSLSGSGLIISNAVSSKNLTLGVPSSYSGL